MPIRKFHLCVQAVHRNLATYKFIFISSTKSLSLLPGMARVTNPRENIRLSYTHGCIHPVLLESGLAHPTG